jgi:hypothetical protein
MVFGSTDSTTKFLDTPSFWNEFFMTITTSAVLCIYLALNMRLFDVYFDNLQTQYLV